MRFINAMLSLLLSLRTTIWLTLLLLAVLFYGSLVMPLNEEFQALHTVPLFQWLADNPAGITWWLLAAIGILSLLTANTIFCSIESLVKKRRARQFLLVVSPQVIHLGFLFILLAHLMSSYGSFRGMAMVTNGTLLQLPSGLAVSFDKIDADTDRSGYLSNWSAAVTYYDKDGGLISSDVISPNNPSFRSGLGVYIKTVTPGVVPSALIEVSRDPGAVWALAGGILFLVGMMTLLLLKVRREDAAEV